MGRLSTKKCNVFEVYNHGWETLFVRNARGYLCGECQLKLRNNNLSLRMLLGAFHPRSLIMPELGSLVGLD